MATKAIPMLGESYLGSNPEAQKVLKITMGKASTNDITYATSVASTWRDLVTFGAGVVIDAIVAVNNSTQALMAVASRFRLGDTTNTSGYWQIATATVSNGWKTAGYWMKRNTLTTVSQTYKQGKRYTAAGRIRATYTTKLNTNAVMEFYIYYHMAGTN